MRAKKSMMKMPEYKIGCDIVEVGRIKELKQSTLEHLFCDIEIEYFLRYKQPEEHIAGYFCAKESILKALGTGITPSVGWKDIIITHNKLGKPLVCTSSKIFEKFNIKYIEISISHSKHNAIANALVLFG